MSDADGFEFRFFFILGKSYFVSIRLPGQESFFYSQLGANSLTRINILYLISAGSKLKNVLHKNVFSCSLEGFLVLILNLCGKRVI